MTDETACDSGGLGTGETSAHRDAVGEEARDPGRRSRSLSQFGVPWAIVAGMTLRLLFFIWYYLTGKWLRTGLL